MPQHDLSWTVPVMRAGYAGRGLVYLVLAGFSLYAIWRGGRAMGTSSALGDLENTTGGGIVLFLIFLGMLAYAVWRLINAWYDLENHGSDGKGIAARIGVAVSGLVHLAIGFVAFSLLFAGGGQGGGGQGGGGSSIESWIGKIMEWPAGRFVVAAIGLVVIGAAIYYIYKGWTQSYRKRLVANRFTTNWNWLLRGGLFAHGAVVAIIGGLILYAAWRANPQAAGGVGDAFSWLTGQPFGQVLVVVICLGLAGFALFCFVNAAYRVVPKVSGPDIETVAMRLKAST